MGMIIQNGKQYFPVYNDAIVKALPTVDTASGSVATFDTDLTENLIEVKCQIVAQQGGSGTPSPSNPRPIGVYDSLTLYHNDINIWDEQWELGAYNVNDGEKYNSSTQIRCKNKISIQPNTRYFKALSGTGTVWWQIYFDKYGNYLSYNGANANSEFITPNNAYYMVFYCEANYGTIYNNDISINYPSTETEYHAFNGAYIPFGQTVANGVLDVTTGKLRVTWGEVDLSTLPFSYDSGSKRWQVTLSGVVVYPTRNGDIYAEKYVADITANVGDEYKMFTVGGALYIYYTDSTTPPTGKLVYPLATPIEIQLDSITLQALLNENNIWCDTGDTEVKYLLTVGKKIS